MRPSSAACDYRAIYFLHLHFSCLVARDAGVHWRFCFWLCSRAVSRWSSFPTALHAVRGGPSFSSRTSPASISQSIKLAVYISQNHRLHGLSFFCLAVGIFAPLGSRSATPSLSDACTVACEFRAIPFSQSTHSDAW